MNLFDHKQHSHRRLNILTGEWILVSPHRTKRPWQGKIESLQDEGSKQYDPGCYLCPGNKRADGAINPLYDSTYVFTNDFSALLKDTPEGIYQQDNLLKAKSESGICRVITFSPHHDVALPELTKEEIKNVIDVWCVEFEKLAANAVIKSIQIFENKGEMMGCSNPHPHGQIWAQTSLPQEIIKETSQQQLYFSDHKKSLLSDYIELEAKLKERVVEENDYFIVLVPFWAVWPYETILISKRHVQNILMFTEEEKYGYADMLKKLTTRYDNLFQISFPYSAGMHQAAVNDGDHPEWHWHMHFYPPLLRSATVKKYMVGYEMLANAQRDVTAEWAAERLRSVSNKHYKEVPNKMNAVR